MADKEQMIPITIWLCERSYRIRVRPSEEEAIRMAVRMAEKRLNELRSGLAGKDDQDFLAMCLIMYATDQITEPEGMNPVVLEKIEQIAEKVDKIIQL